MTYLEENDYIPSLLTNLYLCLIN